MNNITILGRLTRDPELRFIPGSGTAVASYSVAVDKKVTKEKLERLKAEGLPTANFFNIRTFGKQAENDAKFTAKGKLICISGSMETEDYKKDGTKKSFDYILANKVEYVEWKDSSQSEEPHLTAEEFQAIEDDDDIPF